MQKDTCVLCKKDKSISTMKQWTNGDYKCIECLRDLTLERISIFYEGYTIEELREMFEDLDMCELEHYCYRMERRLSK